MTTREDKDNEPKCSCPILNAPADVATSMWMCPAHGEPDDLSPLPGQGLRYCLWVEMGPPYDESVAIGPLTTSDGIETAKLYVRHLGWKVLGVRAMVSYADLEHLAKNKGAPGESISEPTPLPRNAIPTQQHEHGCLYAEQGHPGKCYVVS